MYMIQVPLLALSASNLSQGYPILSGESIIVARRVALTPIEEGICKLDILRIPIISLLIHAPCLASSLTWSQWIEHEDKFITTLLIMHVHYNQQCNKYFFERIVEQFCFWQVVIEAVSLKSIGRYIS